MESEYPDPRFGGIKQTRRLVGTGQFALEATGAFFRFYLE
jgi:hypothetical protein